MCSYQCILASRVKCFGPRVLIFCIIPATWGGAKLSDVLELVGIPKLSSVSSLGGKHVEFVSVDRCKVSVLVLI